MNSGKLLVCANGQRVSPVVAVDEVVPLRNRLWMGIHPRTDKRHAAVHATGALWSIGQVVGGVNFIKVRDTGDRVRYGQLHAQIL